MMNAVETYLAPTTLAQALAALAAPGGATVLAGGTDLMPQHNAGRLKAAATLLNIRRVQGLSAVALDGDALVIGALATLSALQRDALVCAHAPLLIEAIEHFASDQIRNMATLGGNLCNASPAGDTLTPLLALDAQVELARLAEDGAIATRRLPLAGFFVAPGRTRREPRELLTTVRLPLRGVGQIVRFHKAGTRPALDIATISIALAAQRDGQGRLHEVRLALGAVAPTPVRAHRAEALLEGRQLDAALAEQAAQAAADEATPIDDVRATAWYRRELVRNLTRRMLDDVTHA
ncbi:MAG: FAD binding domain-containing protein [Rubrivivax sp.]